MKTHLITVLSAALLLAVPAAVGAQSADEAAAHAGHQHAHATAFRQGEVLLKLTDDNGIAMHSVSRGRHTPEASPLRQVMQALGTDELEPLMPLTGGEDRPMQVRALNGVPVPVKDLSRLYLLHIDEAQPVDAAIAQLQALDEVEYAEPNYLVYTMDAEDYTGDPRYAEQSYLQSVNVAPLWSVPTVMDHRPVITILDTGVDIEHPDLAANIWTNPAESEGEEDEDDDDNGFKDDVHGWDFVNQTGRIGDWNGHGTHCAGIAAAVGGNQVGIVGANPEALIMPVTVMQSDGTGDVATIIKGIDYAVANGADVISMSIGGYVHSMAEEEALARAYSTTVLVAAAGNNCLPINPSTKCPYCGTYGQPCYPAAFTFVLGVQAGNAVGMFSNYDDDGPIYSRFGEEKLYNYELSAPGVGLLSTYPGGRYKAMSGTSMACPLVAGAVSRLLQTKEYLSQELLFGDLIHTSSSYIDAGAAYAISDADRQPTISLLTYELDDSEGDGDGRPDAGEVIKIWPTVRNDWGQAANVTLSIGMGENEDASLVQFTTATAALGADLSSYAKAKSNNPLVVRLSDDIVDGRHLRLAITATCDNAAEATTQEILLDVENGVELGGTQRENITLVPGVHYIVTRNWGIPKDVIVTVQAGTTLKIKDGVGISNYGHIIFEGDPNNMITITKGDNDLGNIGGFLNDNANYVEFNNVIFEWLRNITFDGHSYEHCVIRNCTVTDNYFSVGGEFRDCDIYNNEIPGRAAGYLSSGATFIGCNVHNNEFCNPASGGFGSAARFYHSNYIGNVITSPSVSTPSYNTLEESNCYGNLYDALGGFYSIALNTTEPEIFYLSKAYLGTSVKSLAYESILDEADNVGWGHVDVWQMLDMAAKDAPGCVDYITVDGVDPQDEAEDMNPLGVGTHQVKVMFNRAMDQNVAPTISMGVRTPYTQKVIAENGAWEDPYTYSASITITGKSATDGSNRLRVTGYKQKNSDFEMPAEHYRYNVMVQAAGSMSTGMIAEPGLGKVTLTWETVDEDFDDIMGYNIYRFTRDANDESSDTLRINDTMLESTEETYIDYDVVPGTTYYYFIKEVGTDFTGNDVSRTVACTPQTAQKGDANGSQTVDVADIVTVVEWLSGADPQPFIFEAADVNEDSQVNILDVVGTVNMIVPTPDMQSQSVDGTVTYTIEDGILYVESTQALGGVQLMLNVGEETTVKGLEGLDGFEQLQVRTGEKSLFFLAYSMAGKSIAPGRQPLLRIGSEAGIDEIVVSDAHGRNMVALNGTATSVRNINDLPYGIAESDNVTVAYYDLSGRRVDPQTVGAGAYIVRMSVDGNVVRSYKLFVK